MFSYDFRAVLAAAPAASSKEGEGGGMMPERAFGTNEPWQLLDGLKVSCGIENVTNARPPFIGQTFDASNTDASINDPYQRQYYFVVTKKF